MKITILGGSNSVASYSLTKGISDITPTLNCALGASSSLQNIYALKKSWTDISDRDIIITESNVNDIVLVNRSLVPIDIMLSNIDKLYYELYLTGKNILALIFPIRLYQSMEEMKVVNKIINRHRKNIEKYNFDLLDLSEFLSHYDENNRFTPMIMHDSLHLSYAFLYHLGSNIANYFLINGCWSRKEMLNNSLFSVVLAKDLPQGKKEIKENRGFRELVSIIDKEMIILKVPNAKIVGIGAWSDAYSCMLINNIVIKEFNSLNSFNEIVEDIKIKDSKIKISSIFGKKPKNIERSILVNQTDALEKPVKVTGFLLELNKTNLNIQDIELKGKNLKSIIPSPISYIKAEEKYTRVHLQNNFNDFFLNTVIIDGKNKVYQERLDNHYLDFYKGNENLVITFDEFGYKDNVKYRTPWHFKFLKKQGFSVLGVKCCSNDWYRNEELYRFFRSYTFQKIIKKFKNIALYGNNMGGFASLTFASVVPNAIVFAVSPLSTLNQELVPWEDRYKSSASDLDWEKDFHDAYFGAKNASRVYIYYDPYFALDKRHIDRLDQENIIHLPFAFIEEDIRVSIEESEVLKKMILNIFNGIELEKEFSTLGINAIEKGLA